MSETYIIETLQVERKKHHFIIQYIHFSVLTGKKMRKFMAKAYQHNSIHFAGILNGNFSFYSWEKKAYTYIWRKVDMGWWNVSYFCLLQNRREIGCCLDHLYVKWVAHEIYRKKICEFLYVVVFKHNVRVYVQKGIQHRGKCVVNFPLCIYLYRRKHLCRTRI